MGPAWSRSAQFDLTLQKRFAITERVNLEFRSEIYNILNRANFANPPARLNNSLGTGSGQIQPGQPFTFSAAGGAFGIANSTVTKDVGLGDEPPDSVVASSELLTTDDRCHSRAACFIAAALLSFVILLA